jgi:hypothetical protein
LVIAIGQCSGHCDHATNNSKRLRDETCGGFLRTFAMAFLMVIALIIPTIVAVKNCDDYRDEKTN